MTKKRYIETGFRVAAKDRPTIRRIAHHVHDLARGYGLSADGPFPITALVEKWHELRAAGQAAYPAYRLVEEAELPGRDAEFRPPLPDVGEVPGQNLFLFRRSIWVAAERGDPAAREIVAHEVGHCVLDHPQPTYARRYDEGRLAPQIDSEWQASVFMEELLMDHGAIGRDHGWGEVMTHFGVTQATAVARLRQLLDERRRRVARRGES